MWQLPVKCLLFPPPPEYTGPINSSTRRLTTFWNAKITQQKIRSMLFWDILQCIAGIPYRCFETIYQSHLKGSRIQEGCPKTSVRNYHYMLRNIPEEHRSHLLQGRSLKTHTATNELVSDKQLENSVEGNSCGLIWYTIQPTKNSYVTGARIILQEIHFWDLPVKSMRWFTHT
jgi:hypothetical protein